MPLPDTRLFPVFRRRRSCGKGQGPEAIAKFFQVVKRPQIDSVAPILNVKTFGTAGAMGGRRPVGPALRDRPVIPAIDGRDYAVAALTLTGPATAQLRRYVPAPVRPADCRTVFG